MIIITRLKLKSILHFPKALAMSVAVVQELEQNKDCQGYQVRVRLLNLYTMTRWPNREASKSFSRKGRHRDAMKASPGMAAKIQTIVLQEDQFPSWKEALKMFRQQSA